VAREIEDAFISVNELPASGKPAGNSQYLMGEPEKPVKKKKIIPK
jgi:hypothetical protein